MSPVSDAEREALRRAIVEQVVLLGDVPSFDFKELLTQARHARTAGRLLWSLVRAQRPQVLVGPGFGGVPLACATALAALDEDGIDLAIWMVRDQRKGYFRRRWIEGPRFDEVPPRVVIVDDFLGKGSSVELVEQALKEEGRTVELCALAVLFDHWTPLGSRRLAVSRFPVLSVFRRHDIGLSRDCHDARPPRMHGSAPAFVDRPSWWRFDFNGHGSRPYKSSPVVADDAVFAADDRSRIWRFDGRSGEAAWCRPSLAEPHKGIVQQLQHVDGSVVAGCYDGTVTRLDAADGRVLWRWRVDSHVHATPVVDLAGQRLFVNTEHNRGGEPRGHLQALDWASGRVLWRHALPFWPPATVAWSAEHRAVVSNANDQSMVCVDADTGVPRWHVQTRGLVRGRPAISGDAVLVATESGWLQRFDLRSGDCTHERRHGAGLPHQFLHVAGGVVHALTDSAHLAAFDAADLRLRWLGALRSPGCWAPVPFGDWLVVLSREGHLAVFARDDGRKPWEGRVTGEFRQQPAIGRVHGRPVLACASHRDGLQLFDIDPHYEQDEQVSA